jgi:hypothetical protein
MFAWPKDGDERPPVPYRFVETYSQLPADENGKGHRYDRLQGSLDGALPYICFLGRYRAFDYNLKLCLSAYTGF